MNIENMPVKVLNTPRKEEITIVVITPEVKANIGITVPTLVKFQAWLKDNNLDEKNFTEGLKHSVGNYLLNGGYKVNIVIVHSYSGHNHMFIA